jgi:O-antigen/teichoic acid export membrane protein
MTTSSTSDDTPLSRHAVRAVGWTFFEKWVTRLTSLVVFAVLGHLLPITAFGLVAMAAVIIDFLLMFADQGISRAVVVARDPQPRFISTAFWLSILSGALLFGLLFVTAPLLANAFDQPGLTNILRALGGTFLLYGVSSVPEAVLQRDLKFQAIATRRVCASLAGGALGVTAAVFGAGAWALVLQSLSAYAIGGIVIWKYSTFRPSFTFDTTEARSIWNFGISVLGIDALSWVSRNGDNLVVGAFLGPRALGIYSVSYKILSIVTELVVGVVSASSLPIFAKVAHDAQLTVRALMRATRATATLSAPIFALLAVEAHLVVPLVYGDKWDPAVPIVQIFCIVGLLNAVTSMDRSVLLAAKRQRLELGVTAGGALLNVVGFLIGVHWGYQGVAVALVVRGYAYWPVRLWALRRVTGMNIATYVKQWLVPISAAVALVAAAFGAQQVFDTLADIPLLVISGGVGLATYVAVLLFIDDDVRQLAQRRSFQRTRTSVAVD